MTDPKTLTLPRAETEAAMSRECETCGGSGQEPGDLHQGCRPCGNTGWLPGVLYRPIDLPSDLTVIDLVTDERHLSRYDGSEWLLVADTNDQLITAPFQRGDVVEIRNDCQSHSHCPDCETEFRCPGKAECVEILSVGVDRYDCTCNPKGPCDCDPLFRFKFETGRVG